MELFEKIFQNSLHYRSKYLLKFSAKNDQVSKYILGVSTCARAWHHQSMCFPRSNQRDRLRSRTDNYDQARPYFSMLYEIVLRSCISVPYMEKYADLRRRKWSFFPEYTEIVYGLRFPQYFTVFVRVRSHITCRNTIAYDRRSSVCDKLRSCTDFVGLDLERCTGQRSLALDLTPRTSLTLLESSTNCTQKG